MTWGLIPFRSDFSDFRRHVDQLDRLFDSVKPQQQAASNGELLVPALDISESDKEYVVTVEAPGMEEKDVTVNLVGNLLSIRGEKRIEHERKKDGYSYQERRFGKFQRQITLPDKVEGEKVVAKYKAGVLEVRVPKSPEVQPRNIKIEVARD